MSCWPVKYVILSGNVCHGYFPKGSGTVSKSNVQEAGSVLVKCLLTQKHQEKCTDETSSLWGRLQTL